MSPLNDRNIDRNIDLQTLVRVALHNRELAPGVAKQINLLRATLLPATEKRLLAVLDDAIASGLITVIEPVNHQPTLLSAHTPTILSSQANN